MEISSLKRKALFLVSATALMLMASASANATILSVSPTGGSVGDNIVSANCNGGTPANTSLPVITGCLNGDHNSLVHFSSDENVQFNAGGQAVVTATDGLMDQLTVDPVSFDLGELIVNINAVADGWVKFCDNNGCFSTLFAVNQSGQNFFDITFSPKAQYVTMYTYSDALGVFAAQLIQDTKQWRLSETIPEPLTMSLFLAGLTGVVALRRRKKAWLVQKPY